MLPMREVFPLALNFIVGFQCGAGFGIFDAHLVAALQQMIHDNGIETGALQLGFYGDQQKIDGVVFLPLVI